MGRLIVVEGGSGSGKSALVESLSGSGVSVRGVASQDPTENGKLTELSRLVLGDTVLNFGEVVRGDSATRYDVFRRFIQISKIQLNEALRLESSGKNVFLNRSPISVEGLIGLAKEILCKSDREEARAWAREMRDLNGYGLKSVALRADGIVLLEGIYGGGKEREGMRGVQEKEAERVSIATRRVALDGEIPLLVLDPNTLSVDQEVKKVRQFFGISTNN